MGQKFDYLDSLIYESGKNISIKDDYDERLLNKIHCMEEDSSAEFYRHSIAMDRVMAVSFIFSGIFIIIINFTKAEGYIFDGLIRAKGFTSFINNYFFNLLGTVLDFSARFQRVF